MKIHTIDLNFQGISKTIASFLVEIADRLILIETGPATTRDTLLNNIKQLGYDPMDISDVLVTHIHLDHSGDAGWWGSQGKTVWVHEKGAKHLIAPSILISSATQVYGDSMETLWGEILPVPKDKIQTLSDNQSFISKDLPVTALDTPGHAYHHMCFSIEDTVFVGDLAGIKIGETDYIEPATAPPQFNLEAYEGSFQKVLSYSPKTLHLTHFGVVEDPVNHLENYHTVLRQTVDFANSLEDPNLSSKTNYQLYDQFIETQFDKYRLSEEDRLRYKTVNPPPMCIDGVLLYLLKLLSQGN